MPFKKGNRYGGRRGARNSLANTRTPTSPQVRDAYSDEVMQDDENDEVPGDDEDLHMNGTTTPKNQDDDEDEDDDVQNENDNDDEDDAQPTITSVPRRRPGRPRGSTAKRSRRDVGTPDPGEDYSESGTPRRRRGRPLGSGMSRGRGGFRGRRKGQQPETPRVVIDKQGTTLDVVDDEALVDHDDAGERKVDKNGQLKGGREYRVRTFTIMSRGDRLYMLSTEPARCCGFRDSYLFFTKHPKLYKVLISEEEKMDLIAREILPNSYKGRNIGVVTARSVFREFGARIIVGGRRVTDDYKETEARTSGVPEGELADPDDYVPDNREEYNRNRYVAWFGASDVYRQAAGGGQVPVKAAIGKRRTNITTSNWQHLHARESSRFNSSLTALRRANLNGVYDTHTNMLFFPRITQPTHARWEEVPPSSSQNTREQLTNGVSPYESMPDTDIIRPTPASAAGDTIFSDVPAVIARNFTIVDVAYKAPPLSNIGYPGPDGNIVDQTAGSGGLGSVAPDLINELPENCRHVFLEARASEMEWKKQWGTEHQTAARGHLKIGFSGYPV